MTDMLYSHRIYPADGLIHSGPPTLTPGAATWAVDLRFISHKLHLLS
jgi:hypothetical protein